MTQSRAPDLPSPELPSPDLSSPDLAPLELPSLARELSDGLIVLDGSGRVRDINPAAERLFGCRADDVLNARISDLLPGYRIAAASDGGGGELQSPGPQPWTALRRDGTAHPVEVAEAAGGRSRAAGTLLLVKDLARTDELAEAAHRYEKSQTFGNIGTWDWRIDADDLFWSDTVYTMFGYRPGEVTPSYSLYCEAVHPDDREKVRQEEVRCIETGDNHDIEYRVVWPDGTVRWLRETGNTITDRSGRPVRMMGVVRDITDERLVVDEMRILAHHDPLTSLPNRLLFEDRLQQAIERAKRHNRMVGIIFIDLNNFKPVNDEFGHMAGDQVLIAIANRLRKAVRQSDTVSRIGGDEFVLILDELKSADGARRVAEKVLEAISVPYEIGGQKRAVSASLGISLYPDHGTSLDQLIHVADLAMYAAKREGDNLYRFGQGEVH